MRIPYIGVSGVGACTQDIVALLQARNVQVPLDLSGHIICFGLLATGSTIGCGGKHPSKTARYPPPSEWMQAAAWLPAWARLVVHIGHRAGEDPNVLLAALQEHLPAEADGIQWNTTLDGAGSDELVEALGPWTGMRVILQLRITSGSNGDIDKAMAAIEKHMKIGAITDVLIDGSAGHGKALDLRFTTRLLHQIVASYGDESIGVGVAGGLGPSNLATLRTIIEEFPGISIDAESALRDANDQLSFAAVALYVYEAAKMFAAQWGRSK